MANVKGGAAPAVAQRKNQPSMVSVEIQKEGVKKLFADMLGKKAPGFLSSLAALTRQNSGLQSVDPKTVLACAATAAALDLPINPSLGMAYVVPYKGSAQFQMGWKGYVNLLQRSGYCKHVGAEKVYEGEITDWNRFAETYQPGPKISDKVVGYFAYFELVNGFRKCSYWTKEEVEAHAKKFSASYKNPSGAWQTNFDAMACKTVLLSIIKYAPLSIEMQSAFENDGKQMTMTTNDDETIDISIAESDTEESFLQAEVIEQ